MLQRDPLKDGISNVELLDVMGDDLTVANAARVSMHKESQWELAEAESVLLPEYKLSDKDAKLISYLARHNHWTPFSHPQISMRLRMPIFVARQWFKHQVGFSRNEVSRRYVDDPPAIHHPKEWRGRAPNVKQGSSDSPVAWKEPHYRIAVQACEQAYEAMLAAGICPEQARMVLPQSMYTEFVETGSLAAYSRLAKLRLDPHAQLEIRLYAQAVSELIEPQFPVSWKELTQC